MKKQYAFLLMGGDYDPAVHRACFETEKCVSHIRTVRNFEEARALAVELHGRGIGAIEVCGAFTPEQAGELAEATGHEVAVGYGVHDKALDSLFAKFFG